MVEYFARTSYPCFIDTTTGPQVGQRAKVCYSEFARISYYLGSIWYIIGFAENVVAVQIIKPFLNYIGWLDKPIFPTTADDFVVLVHSGRADIINSIQLAYQSMLLCRSLFGAFLFLSISCIVDLIRRRNRITLRLVILVVVVTVTTYALWKNWLQSRDFYYQFTSSSIKLIDDSPTNVKH